MSGILESRARITCPALSLLRSRGRSPKQYINLSGHFPDAQRLHVCVGLHYADAQSALGEGTR